MSIEARVPKGSRRGGGGGGAGKRRENINITDDFNTHIQGVTRVSVNSVRGETLRYFKYKMCNKRVCFEAWFSCEIR